MRRAASSLGATLLDTPGFGALALQMQADTGRRMHHRPIAYRYAACKKWSRRQRHRTPSSSSDENLAPSANVKWMLAFRVLLVVSKDTGVGAKAQSMAKASRV